MYVQVGGPNSGTHTRDLKEAKALLDELQTWGCEGDDLDPSFVHFSASSLRRQRTVAWFVFGFVGRDNSLTLGA